jgi:hypothetical protein
VLPHLFYCTTIRTNLIGLWTTSRRLRKIVSTCHGSLRQAGSKHSARRDDLTQQQISVHFFPDNSTRAPNTVATIRRTKEVSRSNSLPNTQDIHPNQTSGSCAIHSRLLDITAGGGTLSSNRANRLAVWPYYFGSIAERDDPHLSQCKSQTQHHLNIFQR